MTKVASCSMADNVYNKLKEQILNLDIAPGQSLTEEMLAQTFEVSRTPIREALRMLERDQMVELIRNKGAIVRSITESDVNQIFDLRVVMEGWAAQMAAAEITDANLDIIDEKLNLARKELQEGNHREADRYSDEIHDIIAYVVGNKWFTKIIYDLSDYTKAYKVLAVQQQGQLELAQSEHEGIQAALRSHDPQLAKERMVTHIENSRNSIIKALKSRTYMVYEERK